MKSLIFILLSIIFCSNVISQNRYKESELDWDIIAGQRVYFFKNTKQRVNGTVYEKFDNGQLMFENQVDNGKCINYKSWFQNGQLQHDENEQMGIVRDFYENAQLKSIKYSHFTENLGNENEELFIYDKNGFSIFKEFYENGQLKCEYETGSQYDMGLLKGSRNEYFENGMLKERCYFKNGQFDGKYFCWYANGQLKYDGTWSQGEPISEKCWDEKGNPMKCSANYPPRFNK